MKRLMMFMALSMCLFLFVSGTMAIYSTERQWTGSITIADLEQPVEEAGYLRFSKDVSSITLEGATGYTANGWLEVDDANQKFTLHVDVLLTQEAEELNALVAGLEVTNGYAVQACRSVDDVRAESETNTLYLGEMASIEPNGKEPIEFHINSLFVLPSFEASWQETFEFSANLNKVQYLASPEEELWATAGYQTAAIINIRYEKPDFELQGMAADLSSSGNLTYDWESPYHGELAQNSATVHEQAKSIDVALTWVMDKLNEQDSERHLCFQPFAYELAFTNPNAFPIELQAGDQGSIKINAGGNGTLDLGIGKQDILAPAYKAEGDISTHSFEHDLKITYQPEGAEKPYTQTYHIVVMVTLTWPEMLIPEVEETLASPSPSPSPTLDPAATPEPTATLDPAATPTASVTVEPTHTPPPTHTPAPTDAATATPNNDTPPPATEEAPEPTAEVTSAPTSVPVSEPEPEPAPEPEPEPEPAPAPAPEAAPAPEPEPEPEPEPASEPEPAAEVAEAPPV
ncbi:MAG: hypothetical protein RR521_02680 [Clostridia bacterium]